MKNNSEKTGSALNKSCESLDHLLGELWECYQIAYAPGVDIEQEFPCEIGLPDGKTERLSAAAKSKMDLFISEAGKNDPADIQALSERLDELSARENRTHTKNILLFIKQQLKPSDRENKGDGKVRIDGRNGLTNTIRQMLVAVLSSACLLYPAKSGMEDLSQKQASLKRQDIKTKEAFLRAYQQYITYEMLPAYAERIVSDYKTGRKGEKIPEKDLEKIVNGWRSAMMAILPKNPLFEKEPELAQIAHEYFKWGIGHGDVQLTRKKGFFIVRIKDVFMHTALKKAPPERFLDIVTEKMGQISKFYFYYAISDCVSWSKSIIERALNRTINEKDIKMAGDTRLQAETDLENLSASVEADSIVLVYRIPKDR